MHCRVMSSQRIFGCLAVFSAASLCMVSGCGKSDDNPDTGDGPKPKPPLVVVKNAAPQVVPFKQAVSFEAPSGQMRPPDKTYAGKDVAQLFEMIGGKDGTGGLWDKLILTTADGKPMHYRARVETDLGTMEMELLSVEAPNHVRNFVALARAGYFDGLPFHRSLREDVGGRAMGYLESGCPLGEGKLGYGSIGYWLQPELSSLKHEEGSVGAWNDDHLETAACRFYITLSPAPAMDRNYTIFGKITRGLDVAHTINKRPVKLFENWIQDPVLIRTVTIESVSEGATVAAARRE